MNEYIVNRHNELIDPQLHIWGWEIAWYLYLGGIAAGIMVFSALASGGDRDERSRWLSWIPFAAPVLISVGMFLLFLDLEAKHHVYRFYLAFKPASPMSWGAWILVLMYPATIALGLAGLTNHESGALTAWSPLRVTGLGRLVTWLRQQALAHETAVRRVNLLVGLALGLYTGVLLGTLGARPLWNTTLLAVLFLTSGLSTGAAFMMLFPLAKGEHHWLQRWDLVAIAAEAVLLMLFLLDRLTSGAEGAAQAARFLGGDLTPAFWALVVVGGLLVPALLELVESRRSLRPTLAAPVLILVGGLALRWILVQGGQVMPAA
jgi:formate-dependent nitrite reductase membrane component NrfD